MQVKERTINFFYVYVFTFGEFKTFWKQQTRENTCINEQFIHVLMLNRIGEVILREVGSEINAVWTDFNLFEGTSLSVHWRGDHCEDIETVLLV